MMNLAVITETVAAINPQAECLVHGERWALGNFILLDQSRLRGFATQHAHSRFR